MGTSKTTNGAVSDDARSAFREAIETAYRMSADIGPTVERALEHVREQPLTPDEVQSLLTRVLQVLRENAERRGDAETRASLEGDIREIVDGVLRARLGPGKPRANRRITTFPLIAHNDIQPDLVLPSPVFQGREIPMRSGFVRTADLRLWDENERLDIHLEQFKKLRRMNPMPDDVLNIMLSQAELPGIHVKDKEDQFKIQQLAESIAQTGVQRPPILDIDGTLLDGNRRVAACHFILESQRFTPAQRARVEWLFVWQLTEHRTEADRDAVVISLNFPDDCKQQWPDYVRARKLYESWRAMLMLEPRLPDRKREALLKKKLAESFGMAAEMDTVTRYLRMAEWSNDFEDYHVGIRERDQHEVEHVANRYFQYFDELSKGAKNNGVAAKLQSDDRYKHLVYDLLFQDKFRNWELIRHLKHVDRDVFNELQKARDTSDVETAQGDVEEVLLEAANRSTQNRRLGANAKVETFSDFLAGLPLGAFGQDLSKDSCILLLKTFKRLRWQLLEALGPDGLRATLSEAELSDLFGALTALQPQMVTCPKCGHEWVA